MPKQTFDYCLIHLDFTEPRDVVVAAIKMQLNRFSGAAALPHHLARRLVKHVVRQSIEFWICPWCAVGSAIEIEDEPVGVHDQLAA